MRKVRKVLSVVFTFVFTMFILLSSMPAKAEAKKTVIPKVQFASAPITEYTAGDRVQFNIITPNYGGKVEYRVVLWNDSNKSYSDLWNEKNGYPNRYYTKWQPTGNTVFTLGWPITEPGNYRITVYVKRGGIASSKAALTGMNCDSYKQSAAFTVKPRVTLLNKEGQAYGSSDANKPETYKRDIKITAKNVVLSNAKLEGNLYITGDNAVIKNVVVAGNIIVDPGKDGSTTLDNVTAKNIEILSGGQNSIHIKDVQAESMNVRSSTPVRIEADGDTEIVSTSAAGYVIFDRKSGTYGTITITQSSTGETVVEFRGDIRDKIEVEANATIKTGENSKISDLVIATGKVKLEGNFEKVEINSKVEVEVLADTRIESVVANKDTVINLDKTSDVNNVNKGGNTVIINREGQADSDRPSEDSGSGGNSGGGYIPPAVAIGTVTVTGSNTVDQTLTAAVTPTNATVVYQWKRSDTQDGTYTNIAGATSNTYKLTNDDAGKYIKVTATGTGSYGGTRTSGVAEAILGISSVDLTHTINLMGPSAASGLRQVVFLSGAYYADVDAENINNWIIDTGTTNLQVDTIQKPSAHVVMIFYKIKAAGQGTGVGTVTVKAKAGAVTANKDTNAASFVISQSDADKVAAAKTVIAGANYTNLGVADTASTAQKVATVLAVTDGVKGETTTSVYPDGVNYCVVISLNGASDMVNIETATFVLNDEGKVAEAKAAIGGANYTNLVVGDTADAAQKLAAIQAVVDGVKGETTAKVTADGANYSVAISLNGTSNTASITTATFVSSNAGLTKVAGLTDSTPGTQTGADSSSAILWEISVENAKTALAHGDIVTAANATIKLYSDNSFTTEIQNTGSIALAAGANTTAYIKVTAGDKTTVKYYAVTIHRALPAQTGAPEFAAGTSATYMAPITVGEGSLGIKMNLTYKWYRSNDAVYDGGDVEVKTETPTSGDLKSTYTPVEADIGKYLIVVAASTDADGNGIGVTTPVKKMPGVSGPVAEVVGTPTSTQITLKEWLGCEYTIAEIDGVGQAYKWQSSNIFSGLTPNTVYNFKLRPKETSTTLVGYPGALSLNGIRTALPKQTGAPKFIMGLGTLTIGGTIIVGPGDLGIKTNLTCTWYRSNDGVYDTGDFMLRTDILTLEQPTSSYSANIFDLGKYLIVVATSTDADGNGIVATPWTIAKMAYKGATAAVPAVNGSPTSSQIILADLGETYEYAISSIGGVTQNPLNWQPSNIFTGLKGNTDYKFKSRVKETAEILSSDPSQESVGIHTEVEPGAVITGLDIPNNVLQIGEILARKAGTSEPGAGGWKSNTPDVAAVDPDTGIVTAVNPGTAVISYTTSTSGNVNSITVEVYPSASTDDPDIGEVRVNAGNVIPTGYTNAVSEQTITWTSSDTGIATVNSLTGAITPVAEGTATISYKVTDSATGRVVVKGLLEITVQPAKTVSVGGINGTIMAQTAVSGITYQVITSNIADGQAAVITWYKDFPKTSASSPAGITITPAGQVSSDQLTLNVLVNESAPTVAGNYYFTVTIDGVESGVKTLTIYNAATITGAVMDIGTYGYLCLIISLDKIDANSTFDIAKLTYSTMVGGPIYTFAGVYNNGGYLNSLDLSQPPSMGYYYYDINNKKLIIALTNNDSSMIFGLNNFLDTDIISAALGWNVSNTIGAVEVTSVLITEN